MKEGVLYRQFTRQDGTGDFMQFIVPRSLKHAIMYQMHEAVLSGHLGRWKTRERLLQSFYWFGVWEDSDLWVQKCDSCAAIKKLPQNPKHPLDKCQLEHQWTGWQQISLVHYL